MDWFSWLSRTNLHPSLTYDYGVTFARNELEPGDAVFFDHEFLQSMGISVAKHRLEILKLAKKDNGANKKLSQVVKKCWRKCVKKLVVSRDEAGKEIPCETNWLVQRRGSLKEEKPKPMGTPYRTRSLEFSGPLDGRVHEKVITNNKVLKLSGPLDGRMIHPSRSPMVPRPVDHGRLMGSAMSPRLSGLPLPGSRSPRPNWAADVVTDSPMGFSPCYQKKNAKSEQDYDDDENTPVAHNVSRSETNLNFFPVLWFRH
ncbi:uncharacterized protein LOC114713476 [Neltuma alba]|uniref:uncharacterized protein LOC114713476 n=1 Tax=Neltuma alba TaxID=207710 RepID=UPI0010A44ADE|nr:uncharacterized protein LOC114713476 [Prosopis alba]